MPAYVVAKDADARGDRLGPARPPTPELLAVSGIGPAKLERYGDEILAVVDASAPDARHGEAMGETDAMAFGQQSGPPANSRQLKELLGLLNEAGYADFRSARGPLGFTQRQGGGKFTVDEADAFIEQLQAEADAADEAADAPVAADEPAPKPKPTQKAERLTAAEQALRKVPDAKLAAELQRRGWIVVEP